jgi:hypothetical protein
VSAVMKIVVPLRHLADVPIDLDQFYGNCSTPFADGQRIASQLR